MESRHLPAESRQIEIMESNLAKMKDEVVSLTCAIVCSEATGADADAKAAATARQRRANVCLAIDALQAEIDKLRPQE